MIANYTVTGMSCEHCVTSVTNELSQLPGVQSVKVDLGSGIVTVDSTQSLVHADVAAAIDEAGYDLTDTVSAPSL